MIIQNQNQKIAQGLSIIEILNIALVNEVKICTDYYVFSHFYMGIGCEVLLEGLKITNLSALFSVLTCVKSINYQIVKLTKDLTL